jgi:hypothetical protein
MKRKRGQHRQRPGELSFEISSNSVVSDGLLLLSG